METDVHGDYSEDIHEDYSDDVPEDLGEDDSDSIYNNIDFISNSTVVTLVGILNFCHRIYKRNFHLRNVAMWGPPRAASRCPCSTGSRCWGSSWRCCSPWPWWPWSPAGGPGSGQTSRSASQFLKPSLGLQTTDQFKSFLLKVQELSHWLQVYIMFPGWAWLPHARVWAWGAAWLWRADGDWAAGAALIPGGGLSPGARAVLTSVLTSRLVNQNPEMLWYLYSAANKMNVSFFLFRCLRQLYQYQLVHWNRNFIVKSCSQFHCPNPSSK